MSIYEDNGYKNRKDYLNSLAEDYGVGVSEVYALAEILGDTEDRLNDRTFKYAHTLHAEENCMLFSNRTYLEGCTIYISHPPCTKCLSVMKQRKLTKVVCYSGNEDFRSRWGDNSNTLALSEELGIEVKIYQN